MFKEIFPLFYDVLMLNILYMCVCVCVCACAVYICVLRLHIVLQSPGDGRE
jgi:hypothetical protein